MAQAPQAQGAESPSPLISLMPLILMFVIFYFLLIRPQQKKQKDHNRMVSEIKKIASENVKDINKIERWVRYAVSGN